MPKTVAPHRWFQGWRATETAGQTDAADLGTAFGLDLSLCESTPQAPPGKAPVQSQPGRVRRLATRAKPLA